MLLTPKWLVISYVLGVMMGYGLFGIAMLGIDCNSSEYIQYQNNCKMIKDITHIMILVVPAIIPILYYCYQKEVMIKNENRL